MTPYAKHYQNNLLKMVKRIFEMAVEEGVLAKNPALSIKVKVPQDLRNSSNSFDHLAPKPFEAPLNGAHCKEHG